jgi:hypothetical protein
MKIWLTLFGFVISAQSFAQADRCVSIKNDVARLACFDRSMKPTTAAPAPPKGKGKWKYEIDDDQMSGGKRAFATLNSENSLSLSFPYSGKQQPSLMLRRVGKRVDVMVMIEKGQIICQIGGCSVKVKFDGQPAIRYSANGPADHGSTMLFLSPAGTFTERLKKSSKLLVELNIYQAGTNVIEFDTTGLDWK